MTTETETTITTAPEGFAAFGLPPKLLQALARAEFTTPTPIQASALPLALAGRDILGSAQTGTGKTAAFAIPIIVGLMARPDATALVLTPTRELATQVMAAIRHLIPVPDIRAALLIGGESMGKQFRQLQAHPRLIVGTPGRINDHLQRGTVRLQNTRYLVLDETDRMLDMGFGVQIERITAHLPADRQTMLFSATIAPGIAKLAGKYLRNPERVSVGSVTTAAPNIKQQLVRTSDGEKSTHLKAALDAAPGSVIVFVKTKHGADRLAERLSRLDYGADAIHGDLRQGQRDRVIRDFRDGKFKILVATDIAARGLDVPHIETVINYDLPPCPEDFIHRIGRTGRAGASGEAISFLTAADEPKWRAIDRLMNPGAPREKHAGGNGQDRFRGQARPPARKGGRGRRSNGGGRAAIGA
jgi:superfamily II DNA/RNA helicase